MFLWRAWRLSHGEARLCGEKSLRLGHHAFSLLFTYSVTYIAQYVVLRKIHWIQHLHVADCSGLVLLPRPVSDDEFYGAGAEFCWNPPSDRRREGDGRLLADCHAECEAGMDGRGILPSPAWNSGGQFTYSENLKPDAECVQQHAAVSGGGCRARRRRDPGRCHNVPPVLLSLCARATSWRR